MPCTDQQFAFAASSGDLPRFRRAERGLADLLGRNLRHHWPETVALITSLPVSELSASQWLKDSRAARGIETGLHQHLDVSHLDDPAVCMSLKRCA